MKKTNNKKTNGLATKKDLKNTEAVFEIKLKNTEHIFDKKLKETEGRLNKRIDRMEKNIDYKLEPIIEFKNEFSGFKSSVLKTLDWLVGAFKKFEEEYVVASEQTHRVNDKLDNHEGRISSLEQRVVAP